jgi:hypothetical protein
MMDPDLDGVSTTKEKMAKQPAQTGSDGNELQFDDRKNAQRSVVCLFETYVSDR